MSPARIISLWLGLSASEGASRSVGMKVFVHRMEVDSYTKKDRDPEDRRREAESGRPQPKSRPGESSLRWSQEASSLSPGGDTQGHRPSRAPVCRLRALLSQRMSRLDLELGLELHVIAAAGIRNRGADA